MDVVKIFKRSKKKCLITYYYKCMIKKQVIKQNNEFYIVNFE